MARRTRSQARRTPTAAQIVSCALNCPSVVPVASSTNVSKHAAGPRPSNHRWRLPSSCTSSPQWAFARGVGDADSACAPDSTGLRPASNGAACRGCTYTPSSLAKCSAASVGPNRALDRAAVFLAYQGQNVVALRLVARRIGAAAGAPMFQALAPPPRGSADTAVSPAGSSRPSSPPPTVAQRPRLHPRQHPGPRQLSRTHRRPPHSATSRSPA